MSPANEYTALPIKMLASGFSACFADLLTFPLDTAKVRLQVQGEKVLLPDKGSAGVASSQYRGMLRTLATITRNEGARALYNGLQAGLQRQLCFASVRIGLYDSIKSVYQELIYGSKTPDGVQILIPICSGITAGGLAVLFAQPTDVVKVRFQAQMTGNCSRYSSTLQAYSTIAKNEGFKGLWKGTIPNIGRNAIINVAETVSYDVIKGYVLRNNLMTDNTPCHLVCATITGFCATSVASPVDVIKTRYMNSRPGEYKGAIDCAIRTGLQEGTTAFYKGFTPSFYRLVCWNIVMWLTYEKIKKFCSIT